MNRVPLILLTLAVLAGSPVIASQEKPGDQARPPVVHKLRWISAESMRQLLGASSSGFVQWGGAPQRIWINEQLNTLGLEGSPQFETFVDEMIKQFDVKPSTIEFQFHVLRASTGGAEASDGRLPPFLKKVVGDIGALTRYTRFELIDSPLLRATEGDRSQISGEGALAYSILLRPAQVVQDGVRRIRVEGCNIEYRVLAGYTSADGDMVATPDAAEKEMKTQGDYQPVVKPLYRSAGVSTSFTVADGETIVLGASRMPGAGPSSSAGNWAIVTVVTAHILD